MTPGRYMQMRLLSASADLDVVLHKSTVHDDVITESAGPLIQLWYNTMVREALKMGIVHGQVWLRILTHHDRKTVITETILTRQGPIEYHETHIDLFRHHINATIQVYAP